MPFFAVTATEALRQHPIIDSRLEGETIVYPDADADADAEQVNIAIDTEKGLHSTVVRNAGALGVEGFARAIDDLASRVREGRLTSDDHPDGTFTVTTAGSRGALYDTPVVFLPRVEILGTGAVTRRPVVLSRAGEDFIVVCSMVYLELSHDHRIVDGADLVRYLASVKGRLEATEFVFD